MENTTRFNLAQAVNHYIKQINRNHILDADQKDEIRDHFYEINNELKSLGLMPEEAFTIAKMRFGNPYTIEKEYIKSKSTAMLHSVFLQAILLYCAVRLIILSSHHIVFSIWHGNIEHAEVPYIICIKTCIVILGSLILYHLFKKYYFGSITSQFKILAITLASTLFFELYNTIRIPIMLSSMGVNERFEFSWSSFYFFISTRQHILFLLMIFIFCIFSARVFHNSRSLVIN